MQTYKKSREKDIKRILSTVLSAPWNTYCKYPGGACRMNESMNKQAHSFQTCGHMSNLTFSEVKLLEGAHFLNVFSIESSQKMNSYKVLPPHFPWESKIPQQGNGRVTDVTRKALGRLRLAEHFTRAPDRLPGSRTDTPGTAADRQKERPARQAAHPAPCQARSGQQGKDALHFRTTHH